MEILTFDELRNPNNSVEFEGGDHGSTDVSFFVLDFEHGRGPSLHKHDYAEVCILLEGQATFHGPDGDVEVVAGHVWSSLPVSRTPSRARATARSGRSTST